MVNNIRNNQTNGMNKNYTTMTQVYKDMGVPGSAIPNGNWMDPELVRKWKSGFPLTEQERKAVLGFMNSTGTSVNNIGDDGYVM